MTTNPHRPVIKKSLEEMRPSSHSSQKLAQSKTNSIQDNEGSNSMRILADILQLESQNQNPLPSQKPGPSFKGGLASEKHFTPQELNNLHFKSNGSSSQIGVKARPDSKNSTSGAVREGIKKPNINKGATPVNGNSKIHSKPMNNGSGQYQQEFMSSTKTMTQDQQERLKTLAKRPFSVKSSGRPGTASSYGGGGAQNQEDTEENKQEFTLEDDTYEEISVTDEDLESRMKLLRQLDQREKDREELELENVFKDLRSKAGVTDNNDELETLTNVSMLEIKDDKKSINIYKPTLKKKSDPRVTQQPISFYPALSNDKNQKSTILASDNYGQYPLPSKAPQKIVNSIVPLPTGNDGMSRLNDMQNQIRELLRFTEEIKDDLEEFLDDDETQSIISKNENFDEVVDIIVNEQRERGEQIVEMQEKGIADLDTV